MDKTTTFEENFYGINYSITYSISYANKANIVSPSVFEQEYCAIITMLKLVIFNLPILGFIGKSLKIEIREAAEI